MGSLHNIPFLPSIWQPHAITREESLMYRLGPLHVVVSRRAREFRFYYKYDDNQLITDKPTFKRVHTQDWKAEREVLGEQDPYTRYRITGDDSPGLCAIKLYGRCADRPYVARPKSEIQITSGNTIDIFVTTPVWIEFDEVWSNGVIHSLPTWMPRSTWFGPPSGPGPLCYSTKIRARLNYEDIEDYAMRVITHVVLQNDGSKISLDRIVIPTPMLQVFLNSRGELWTESVHIQRTKYDSFSNVKILNTPPEQAGDCRLLSGRREQIPDPLSFSGIIQSLFQHRPNIQLK